MRIKCCLLFTILVPYNYFRYIKEFHEFLEQNPDIPSITLTYEDLHIHPINNIKRLAKFIGVECTDEQAHTVKEICSFENMKKADIEFKEKVVFDEKDKSDEPFGIYRKGDIPVYLI